MRAYFQRFPSPFVVGPMKRKPSRSSSLDRSSESGKVARVEPEQ